MIPEKNCKDKTDNMFCTHSHLTTAMAGLLCIAVAGVGCSISFAQDEALPDIPETAALTPLIWNGSTDGIWKNQDTEETSYWKGGIYADGRPVQFDDSSSVRVISLGDTVAPGSITISANTSRTTSSTNSAELNYGYAFNGPGSITDYTDSNGKVHATSLSLTGMATVVLNTANSFSGGIVMAEDSSLYIGCDHAAGTGTISMKGNSTLLVNYHSEDVAFRAPELSNKLDISGTVKITSGISSYEEERVPTDWRTLNLTGGLSGNGVLNLYGYSYMAMPTDFDSYRANGVSFNYVSSFAINEKQAVSSQGETPERFSGTVRLLNEFNHREKGNHEGEIAADRFLCGAVQLVLVDDVFSKACLNLTRDNPEVRDAGSNKYGAGVRGNAITSDNILVLSENSRITIQSLEAEFLGKGWQFAWDKDNQQTTTALGVKSKFPMNQEDERWAVRVVTDGITNLVLEDDSSNVHVFSGSMGFAHSYTKPTQAYIDVADPSSAGAGSLGVEMLSLEKRGAATQYIHSANLVNLSVMEGTLGFNNLAVSGSLNLAGASVLKLGVTGVGSEENPWKSLSGITNSELTVGSGRLEVSTSAQSAGSTLPAQAKVEGSLTLADTNFTIIFNINGVMPANQNQYAATMLDVSETLKLWDSTAVTLNFSNVNLSTRFYGGQSFYLASAEAIEVWSGSSQLQARDFSQTIALEAGYYGKLQIVENYNKSSKDYLIMTVVGDPRRTWSGMRDGDYVWSDTITPETANNKWKENLDFDNGQLVLFGNLYQPETWDGQKTDLSSDETVKVTSKVLHAGNTVRAGEQGFAINGVADAAVGYQKVQIVGEVAPVSIVIGANYTLDGVDAEDATNYYFFGDGTIRNPEETERYESFGSSATSIRKMGNGTAVLATDNSFSGGTVLEGGRIVMQHRNALGTGQVYIVNGALLQADFESNRSAYEHLRAFEGEQMETTVIQNTVKTSVYVDPNNPDDDALVDARLGNAHNKKMVLTTLVGDSNTVVTLYGFSHAEGQYSYAVYKVLNPDGFSGTVKMDGNLLGTTDPDAAGGKVQLEIMTVDKAKDATGGN